MGEVREILCYVSVAGNNKIADWYEDLTVTEKADTDEFIKTMCKTQDWTGSSYKPSLRGYPKLGELRWDSGNKKHRLIGFFRDGKYVAVMGCYHKQQIYAPADALEQAEKRRKQIVANEVKTVPYEL